MANFLFGGDCCWDPNKTKIRNVVIKDPYLIDTAKGADLFVVNLEGPITELDNPIDKVGPVVKNSPKILGLMHEFGIGAVTLANNHVMDHGETGVRDTIRTLEGANISFFGIDGPETESKSNVTLIKEVNGKTVSLISLCEREFNKLPEAAIWANTVCDIDLFYQIREAKQKSGFLVVIFHGGVEMYPLPSPETVKRMRFIVDLGADCVIMHHSHCISGYEEYKGKAIYYGLGNMIFPYDGTESDTKWNTSYLVQLLIDTDDKQTTKILPIRQRYQGDILYLECVTGESEISFYKTYNKLCEQIKNKDSLIAVWERFCAKDEFSFLKYFAPRGKLFKLLYKFGYSHMDVNHAKIIMNVVRNSSHRERAICALQQYIQRKGSA